MYLVVRLCGWQVSAGAVVPTFAPENMLILFRQRVTSWDLCAQVRVFVTVFALRCIVVIVCDRVRSVNS